MEKRDFADMVIFFCQKVSEMDISQKHKMELLGMITAIEMEHDSQMPKWTPVSEKLPWTDTNVLVTVLDDSGDTSWSYTSIGWITPDGKYWVVDNEVCYGVVAWMPLPEPKEEEDDDE